VAIPAPEPVHQPAPTPPPATAPASPTDAIAREILAVFGPVHGPEALRVGDCESGDHDGKPPYTFDPRAISRTDDWGVMQLNRPSHMRRAQRLGFPWSRMLEVRPNLIVAKNLYDEQGWGPWACRWAA
jgi:hypothetical protein